MIEKIEDNLITVQKELGRVKRLESGNKNYIKIIKKNFPKDFNLIGLRIVIDCANGAGYTRQDLHYLKSSRRKSHCNWNKT